MIILELFSRFRIKYYLFTKLTSQKQPNCTKALQMQLIYNMKRWWVKIELKFTILLLFFYCRLVWEKIPLGDAQYQNKNSKRKKHLLWNRIRKNNTSDLIHFSSRDLTFVTERLRFKPEWVEYKSTPAFS